MRRESCALCSIVHGENSTEIYEESNSFLAVLEEGNIRIFPKKHFVTLLDIPNKLGVELISFVKKVCFKLLESKLGNGFVILSRNLEPAGQDFPHASLLVMPKV